ncbi:Uncharacterised protein [Mycobacteroides abscessus subsp. abscessus]|nr:Uncharacterised protein [Mycobacteroides abscessus subsp. abscessus]
MNKSIVAMLGGVGVAATVALLGAPIAAAGPTPPPGCYAGKSSVNNPQGSCVTPGGVAYEQGAHQPTYEGANPHVPYGTYKINPSQSPSPDNA